MAFSRRKLQHYEPTEGWLASRNPKEKEDIIAWYKREKAILKKRLKGPVNRSFIAHAILVDSETQEPKKKAKEAKTYKVEAWKLSQGDHDIYLGMLDKRFKQLKADYNERIRNARLADSKRRSRKGSKTKQRSESNPSAA